MSENGELAAAEDLDNEAAVLLLKIINEWLKITKEVRQRMSENIERPPLGVKPRYLAAEERYHELLSAISASWAAGYEPDPAWVEEAWEMCQQASMRPD